MKSFLLSRTNSLKQRPHFIHVTIRVFAIGDQRQFYIQALFQRQVESTQRRLDSGIIAVVYNGEVIRIS